MRSLEELFEKLEKQMAGDQKQTHIGDLTPELVKLRQKMLDDREELTEEMELRKQQLEMEARRTLKKEFGERIRETGDMHDEFWGTVYKEMKLDPNGHYKIKQEKKIFLVEKQEGSGQDDTPKFFN